MLVCVCVCVCVCLPRFVCIDTVDTSQVKSKRFFVHACVCLLVCACVCVCLQRFVCINVVDTSEVKDKRLCESLTHPLFGNVLMNSTFLTCRVSN